MWSDRIWNPGPLTYESGAQQTVQRDPAIKYRALTPVFGNGARAFRIGKNSMVLK